MKPTELIALLEILEECSEHVPAELDARIKNVLGYHTDHDTVSGLREFEVLTKDAPTLVQEALAVLKWLREPDYAEEFSLAGMSEWLNQRPVATMCRVVDGCVGVAQASTEWLAAMEDLRTHHSAWRIIMDDAREVASSERDEMDEKGWITHELKAFDRVMAVLLPKGSELPSAEGK